MRHLLRYFLLTLCGAILVLPLSAITKRDAQQLLDQQRYPEAVEALRTLMAQSAANRRDADHNKLLGQALCLSGQYHEAIPYLETAVKANRRSGAQWYLAICRQHTTEYQKALDALNAYRPVLKSATWIARADSLEALCLLGARAMSHVQDVVIIDSLSVPLQDLVGAYRLGAESGRFFQDGATNATDLITALQPVAFENQTRDYRITAPGDGHLYGTHRIQGQWDEPMQLHGIGSELCNVVTPFMLTDGETLYFATDSMPGLGGLDLYKTRYNGDEGVFYAPERLGMPFNSPANDFMMGYDELHRVGWWATDRHAAEGMATIYVFVVESNPSYLDDDDDAAASRARIDRIADTWREGEDYSELLQAIAEAPQEASAPVALAHIIISPTVVYHSEEDFRVAAARQAYQRSVQLEGELATLQSRLAEQRQRYASATASQRQNLHNAIVHGEARQRQLRADIAAAVKAYRRLEQGK